MTKYLKIITPCLCLLMVGCKSTKMVSTTGEIDQSLTAKKLIKNHEKQTADFKTLQTRVRVEYTQGDQSQAYTVTLRMEQDKVIWINSAFSVVRVKITPEKVGFYNKLDNTYFDGDFSLISDFIGTELNFNNVQNILLGDALLAVDDRSYDLDYHEKSYVLFPKNQDPLYELFLLFNPGHFKMDSQQVSQSAAQRMLQVDYLNYQKVEDETLPQNIKIFALEAGEETIITLEYKSVELDKELLFPFKIPEGFDQIVIQ